MKKSTYSILYLSVLFIFISCTTEWDNYDEPAETFRGIINDINSDKSVFTEAGEGGIRMRLMEYSWSDNPTPYYFYVMQDGTFQNTKIFKGTYNVEPQGAFVPLVQTDSEGNTIRDESVTIDIEGTVEVNFDVEPFLNIEWVGEPILNENSISVQVLVTRGTEDPDFQQDVTDIYLYINSSSEYVGNNNFDSRYSTRITGEDANNALGEVITITTNGDLPTNRTHYLRVGARINYSVAGIQRYNYNEPITVGSLDGQ
ncbi:MAG: DUF3823 domain-containing protein [Balneolaceae bacterium]|nr:DUF3823 domain-containing protein [Balneolaceae bacterium]